MYKHQIPAEVLARRAALDANVPKRSLKARPYVCGHSNENRNKPNRERLEIDRHTVPQPWRMMQFPSKSGAKTHGTSLAKGG